MESTEIQDWKGNLEIMGHSEMARLWRYAPAGHIVFSEECLYALFNKRFKEFGGWTDKISKLIER